MTATAKLEEGIYGKRSFSVFAKQSRAASKAGNSGSVGTRGRIDEVWAVDSTYIKLGKSHMYLTAIIDWYSRFIVGWELSDTLDSVPVLKAVKKAIGLYGISEIINSDQVSQFTSVEYTSFLAVKKSDKAWTVRRVGLIM